MDREPRSGVREKKGDRDRLIGLAETHPEWVLGFEDETWFWSPRERKRSIEMCVPLSSTNTRRLTSK
jgi:hypothetical protein